MKVIWGIYNWGGWLAAKSMQWMTGDNISLFQWGYEWADEECMREILANFRIDSPPRYGLIQAVFYGNLGAVKVILADGRINPTFIFGKPVELTYALEKNNFDIARVIFADNRVGDCIRWDNLPGETFVLIRQFVREEHVRQSAVVAWIGTQIGGGWKDLMCDIFVQYAGALYIFNI